MKVKRMVAAISIITLSLLSLILSVSLSSSSLTRGKEGILILVALIIFSLVALYIVTIVIIGTLVSLREKEIEGEA